MARTKWRRDAAKERFWRKAVRGWQRSGLSIRAYCANNQLNVNNFHGWRREIVRRDGEKSRKTGLSRQPKPRANLFLPVQALLDASSGRIEIVLSSNRIVRVEPGFDRLALRDVVTTLEALPC